MKTKSKGNTHKGSSPLMIKVKDFAMEALKRYDDFFSKIKKGSLGEYTMKEKSGGHSMNKWKRKYPLGSYTQAYLEAKIQSS